MQAYDWLLAFSKLLAAYKACQVAKRWHARQRSAYAVQVTPYLCHLSYDEDAVANMCNYAG